MSIAGLVDVPVEIIGGLVTNIAPADLPHGTSPDCQDIAFQIGSGKTRPGVTSLYQLIGNPTINYLKTYENLQEVPRLLSLDSLGVLRKDVAPGGALATISNGILPGSSCKSSSLFGREYLAFGNPFEGLDIPRQYDDTNFDRVSQVGPAAAPQAEDENVVLNTLGSPAGLTPEPASPIAPGVVGLVEAGNVVTVTLTGGNQLFLGFAVGNQVVIAGAGVPAFDGTWVVSKLLTIPGAAGNGQFQFIHNQAGLAASGGGTVDQGVVNAIFAANPPVSVGQTVTIAGAGVAGYNGTFTVTALSALEFFYNVVGAASLANSGGATVTAIGNIPAGKHQLSVIFQTRSGYYTRPAPPNFWIAAGGKRVMVVNIPIGPPNVIARVLCFTGVGGASFYHLGPTGITLFSSNMVIPDNVTTSVTVDFTDGQLLLGTLDDPLFTQIVLPPSAGSIDYSTRLFWWGSQANIQNVLNLSFDGSFSNLTSAATGTAPNFPLGWILDGGGNAPGGGSALVNGNPAVFGDAYRIVGDGATAVRGKITQPMNQDYLLNPILLPNTVYSVRARIQVIGATAGTIHVNLQSTIGAFTTVGISKAWNTLTGTYVAYIGNLTAGLAVIPSDLQLQLYVDGTANNGGIFLIDEIEIFQTNQQFTNSTLLASFGQLPFQGQESYDSETGQIQYNLNDGQSIRSCFKIRERLYVVKEHSFGVTQDDGVHEPSGWTIDDVSKKVGTPSVNGVGIGEDWAVIAHRTGLYIFWGGGVEKISQEIQPTWDSINWQYGYLISVTVDTRRRRIFVCAPFGASTIPNKTLVLDYHDVGSDASSIAAAPPIHLTYTGRKTAFDTARKWCPWTIPANSVAQIEQADLQTLVYFGSNDGTGNINLLDDTGTIYTDNGATIPSYYTTAFFVEQSMEQQLKLSSHRKLFAYFTTYTQGVGTLGVTVFMDTLSNAIALNPQPLANPATFDIEMGINQTKERMAVKLSSGGNGQWFDFQKMVVNVSPDPWAPVAGSPY